LKGTLSVPGQGGAGHGRGLVKMKGTSRFARKLLQTGKPVPLSEKKEVPSAEKKELFPARKTS